MKALWDRRTQELEWVQPSRGRRGYELRAGDDVFAWLRFPKMFGNLAIATVAEGACRLHKTGRLNVTVRIGPPDSDFDVAVFRGKWDGPGTLTYRDRRDYRWENTNWSHTDWEWTTGSSSMPLLTFRRRAVRIGSGAASHSDLALMACLGWYLRILQTDRIQAAAAAVAISMAQSR
jgi:hypothetical protein